MLLDRLLISALIEGRSCERFTLLANGLSSAELRGFYAGLMESEARHYRLFCRLAEERFGFAAARARLAELLDAETERALARRWRDEADQQALHRLVTAYMRLAISMAAKYRRYGASMNDLVQEAHIGLLKAAARFDPDRGVRFSTYAVWWIRASVQDFVMRDWSMVRTGSTSSQKSLFFNMRRVRARIERGTGRDRTADAIRREIAEELAQRGVLAQQALDERAPARPRRAKQYQTTLTTRARDRVARRGRFEIVDEEGLRRVARGG